MFIFGCVGSSFLCEALLQLRRVGATLHRGARACHYRGLSCWGAEAPDAQAQSLWLTGPVAPRHVGSSQTRTRTRVPRTGRQTLNHCATREAPALSFYPAATFTWNTKWTVEPLALPLALNCRYFGGYSALCAFTGGSQTSPGQPTRGLVWPCSLDSISRGQSRKRG